VNTQLEYEVQAGYNGWTGILVDFGVGKENQPYLIFLIQH
jgi:hypothetical protein